MADQFKISGDVTTHASSGATQSFNPQIEARLDERLVLSGKTSQSFTLDSDAPFSVDFVGLTNIHCLVLKCLEAKVKASVTTADGTAQVIPVDGLLVLISKSSPVTALSLTRTAGVDTTVRLFLGERAA